MAKSKAKKRPVSKVRVEIKPEVIKPIISSKRPATAKKSPTSIKPAAPAKPPALPQPPAVPLVAPKPKRASTKKTVPAPIITPAVRITIKKSIKPLATGKQAKSAKSKTYAESHQIIGVIPAPLTTDSKPRKNQAGLNPKDLESYREALLAKRRELVGDMSSMEREALRSSSGSNLSNLPIHMADMGTDNYEQEFTLGLVEKERVLLREINGALAKLQDGTYGLCEGTGKPIGKARLEAQPWARHSIEHARTLERHRHR